MSASLPTVGMWAEAEWLHQAFVVAALPFSLFALTSSHANGLVKGLILIGFLLLAGGAFVEAVHDYETLLTVLGGGMLAAGHAFRWVRSYRAGQS